jgi:hypothetical protein
MPDDQPPAHAEPLSNLFGINEMMAYYPDFKRLAQSERKMPDKGSRINHMVFKSLELNDLATTATRDPKWNQTLTAITPFTPPGGCRPLRIIAGRLHTPKDTVLLTVYKRSATVL